MVIGIVLIRSINLPLRARVGVQSIESFFRVGVKKSVVEPMIVGYDGGAHIVDIALLDENGGILYEADSQEVGQLEPVAGSVCWD